MLNTNPFSQKLDVGMCEMKVADVTSVAGASTVQEAYCAIGSTLTNSP